MAALAKLRAIPATRKIVGVTAWDYSSGLLANSAGIDLVLVGDSLSMVALGYSQTTAVTLEQMISHTRAVTRAVKDGFVLADLPLGSYEKSHEHAIDSALRLIKEGRAHGVKLEGGQEMEPTITAITRAGVPVVGHIGITPQRSLGDNTGYTATTVGSKSIVSQEAARQVIEDARAVERAGAVAVVIEAVDAGISQQVTTELRVPTIGIGSGLGCSGQIALQSEILGYQTSLFSRFHKKYADIGELSVRALHQYRQEVVREEFPGKEQTLK